MMTDTQTVSYATPPPRSRHDTIYSVLLGVLAFFLALATVEMAFLAANLSKPETGWVLWMVFSIELLLTATIALTLLVRIVWPDNRKWLTLATNIILLLLFPFGTALGIYGLWKVDKGL